jgi:ribosome recycling factor
MMIDEILEDADSRMYKSIENLHSELAKIRTGRAHPDLLNQITITYYGMQMPLNQVASINVLDGRTLGVKPWEKSMVSPVEKAIMQSDLGLNPVNMGDSLKVPLPTLTEDRRKELTKVVRSETEKARIAVRNVRRDANAMIKESVKDKSISEDDGKRAEDQVQKLTDKYVAQADNACEVKEQELMSM